MGKNNLTELFTQYGTSGTMEALRLRVMMEGRTWKLNAVTDPTMDDFFGRDDLPEDASYVYTFFLRSDDTLYSNVWTRSADATFLHKVIQVTESNIEKMVSHAELHAPVAEILTDTIDHAKSVVSRMTTLLLPEVNGLYVRIKELLDILDEHAVSAKDIEAIAAEAEAEGFYEGPVEGVSEERLRVELELIRDSAKDLVEHMDSITRQSEDPGLKAIFQNELNSFYAAHEDEINDIGYNKACVRQVLTSLSDTTELDEEQINDIVYGNVDADLINGMRHKPLDVKYAGTENYPVASVGTDLSLSPDIKTQVSILELDWAEIILDGMVRNGGFSVSKFPAPAINANGQPYHGVQQLIHSLAQAGQNSHMNVWISKDQMDAYGLYGTTRPGVTTVYGKPNGSLQTIENFNVLDLGMIYFQGRDSVPGFETLVREGSGRKLYDEAMARYDGIRPDSPHFSRQMASLYFAIMTHTDIGPITLTEPMQSILPEGMDRDETARFREETGLSLFAEMVSIGSDCCRIEREMMLQMRIQAELETFRRNEADFNLREGRTYTREEALSIAAGYGLEEEVAREMDRNGLSPADALREWDVMPLAQGQEDAAFEAEM